MGEFLFCGFSASFSFGCGVMGAVLQGGGRGGANVVFWGSFVGLVWSFCGLLELGSEFASFRISLLWRPGSD